MKSSEVIEVPARLAVGKNLYDQPPFTWAVRQYVMEYGETETGKRGLYDRFVTAWNTHGANGVLPPWVRMAMSSYEIPHRHRREKWWLSIGRRVNAMSQALEMGKITIHYSGKSSTSYDSFLDTTRPMLDVMSETIRPLELSIHRYVDEARVTHSRKTGIRIPGTNYSFNHSEPPSVLAHWLQAIQRQELSEGKVGLSQRLVGVDMIGLGMSQPNDGYQYTMGEILGKRQVNQYFRIKGAIFGEE